MDLVPWISSAKGVLSSCLDLINVGHCVVALRNVADAVHRRDVAVHRVESLEYDQLRALGCFRRQQFFEVIDVIMAPDLLVHGSARTPSIIEL